MRQPCAETLTAFLLGLLLGSALGLAGMFAVQQQKGEAVRALDEKYGVGVRQPRVVGD